MARVDRWWSERPRRHPAEYACELARGRVWQEEERFVRTVADVEEAAGLLGLDEAFAHAFVTVLSQLPRAARDAFARDFYGGRRAGQVDSAGFDPRTALAVAAAVVLLVVELTEDPDLQGERVLDLLRGAAQGDDLARTPSPAVAELAAVLVRLRSELAREDPSTARAAAATAVAETLAPSSGVVELREVLVRASWAAVRSWEQPRVLEYLLEVDRILGAAA